MNQSLGMFLRSSLGQGTNSVSSTLATGDILKSEVGACNMKGSKNPFVIFVLMGVGVRGRVMQGEGHSAQCWMGCLSLASRGRIGGLLLQQLVTLSYITNAPLSMVWDKATSPMLPPSYGLPSVTPYCVKVGFKAVPCPKRLHLTNSI